MRNTRVIDVVRELKEFGCSVDVSDPWVSSEDVEREYLGKTTGDFRAYLKQGGVLFDLKGVLPLGAADLRL